MRKKIKLSEVLDVKRGCSLSGDYYTTTGKYIRLTLGNFKYPECGWKNNTSKDDIYFVGPIKKEFILNKGDIITPLTEQVRGLLGNTATVPESDKYIQSGDIGLVIPNTDKLDKRFAYYLVSSPVVKKQLDAGSQQTKIRHTSPDAIKGCYAFVPEDVTEQKRIADLLDLINGKIENNNNVNDCLQRLINDIFIKWFYQFQYPNSVQTKPLDSPIVFNDELKEKLPSGWKVESIAKNSLCSFINVGVPYFKSKNYLATANVDGTDIINGDNITFENRESRANMQPTLNSVWFAKMKNSIKHICISNSDKWMVNKYILSTGFSGLQCSETTFPYIASLIMQPYFEITKDVLSHGATQESVNNDDLESIPIIVPTSEVLEEYKKVVGPYFEKINDIFLENQKLANLRDELLPLLINGQVSI